MIRKVLLTTAATFVLMALASVAHADTVTITGTSTGVLSTATLTTTFDDATNTFTFTITNTSPFDARITGIGFNIGSGNINGFSGANLAGFTFRDGDLGNVPQFNGVVLDFGFTTSNNGNFTNGFPNSGLAPGQSLTFTVTGAGFGDDLTAALLSQAIYVRFQRVGPNGEGSDVGRPGQPNNPVPEPMTMILFGTGLAGVAARVRRQRNRNNA
jgi:hypothetical protein